MSTIYVPPTPFNNQPDQIVLKGTGGLTVASGKFVRLIATCNGTETLIIDGTTVCTAKQWTAYTIGAAAAGTGGTFPSPSGYTQSGATNINGSTWTRSWTEYTSVSIELWLPEGTIISGTCNKIAMEYTNQ